MKNTSENTNQKNKSSKEKLPYVFISTGDLNGIGPEVILKTVSIPELLEICVPVITASQKVILYFRKNLELNQFNFFPATDIHRLNPTKVNVLNTFESEVIVHPGAREKEIQTYTIQSLVKATEAAASMPLNSILVTGPIDKNLVKSETFPYSGHTDYFRKKFNTDALMIMVNQEIKLRVALVTEHIPISNVSEYITPPLLENKIRSFYQSLRRDFLLEKPRIAVLGLNPHAGDNGTIGNDEAEKIIPVMEKLKNEIPYLMGPFSADGFFGSGDYKKFDGILAMYHDQGLIPFKTLSFYEGVNYTAGLPIVRTSPDHGPAYHLSGKRMSSEQSFRNAIFLGLDILKNRKLFDEMTRNPLSSLKLSHEPEIQTGK